jgi:flagellar P-ring protein precursor FlgI
VAQGPLSIGGFSAGQGGTGVQVNHPTVGRIPEGALIEREAPSVVPDPAGLRLQLRRPDHVTASRIAAALNRAFPNAVAEAANAAVVAVRMPAAYALRPVDFIAEIDAIDVETDRRARVVLNERTGTVVIGNTVKVAPVAVLHGNLTVQVVTEYQVSQPAPLSPGQTVVTPQVGVQVQEQQAREVKIKEGATVEELIAALMAIGSTPRDIIAIMQSIAAAGALDAELEMI